MAYPEIVRRIEVISVDRKEKTVAARSKSDPHLEIAHVLFIDVVGYSKLLVNEQRAVIEQLNEIVRKAPQVPKAMLRASSSGFPRATEWRWFSFKRRKSRCNARWKLAKR